jgi:hypothetical protein
VSDKVRIRAAIAVDAEVLTEGAGNEEQMPDALYEWRPAI